MPIYTFSCTDCAKTFDMLVGVSSEKLKHACPFCGSKKIRKQLTAFNVGSAACKYNTGNPPTPCSNTTGCPTCPHY